MRFIIGFLSGVVGALIGGFALAMLVIAVSGPDRDLYGTAATKAGA